MIYIPHPNYNFQNGVANDVNAQWWDGQQSKINLILFPHFLVNGVEPYGVFKEFVSNYYGLHKYSYGFLREDGFEFGFCCYSFGGHSSHRTEISFIPNANLKFRRGVMGDYILERDEIHPFINWAIELVQKTTPLLDYSQLLRQSCEKGIYPLNELYLDCKI